MASALSPSPRGQLRGLLRFRFVDTHLTYTLKPSQTFNYVRTGSQTQPLAEVPGELVKNTDFCILPPTF